MNLFWDTSALVALVFAEPRSPEARAAAAAGTLNMAWRWLAVEAHAALLRRQAQAAHLRSLRRVLDRLQWIDIDAGAVADVVAINERYRLRAADAGHLFCAARARQALGELQLVCFDAELAAAAAKEGVPGFYR